VTAVQILPVTQPSEWQKNYQRFHVKQMDLLKGEPAEPAVTK